MFFVDKSPYCYKRPYSYIIILITAPSEYGYVSTEVLFFFSTKGGEHSVLQRKLALPCRARKDQGCPTSKFEQFTQQGSFRRRITESDIADFVSETLIIDSSDTDFIKVKY